MKKAFCFQWFAGIFFFFLLAGCKSEFEKVRISGNTDMIYKKAFEYFEEGDYLKSQALLELLIPAYRGKKELEQIYFTYAYTYYHDKKYLLASYYFKNFASTFPSSLLREEAEFMSAYANFALSPSFRLDQTYSEKAIDEFQLFINTFPNSDRVKDANQLIDQMRIKLEQKAFTEAELYFNLRQYQASTLSFENLIKDFPETKRGEQVRYMIVKAEYQLAENSIVDKQLERYQSAMKYSREFLNKYAQSAYREEVATIFDRSKNKIKSLENERYQNQSAGSGS